MTAQELAQKLLDFYQNDPKRWTKYDYAFDAEGFEIPSNDPGAVRWCAVGACRALGVESRPLRNALGVFVVDFNDSCKDFDEFRTKLEKVAAGQ